MSTEEGAISSEDECVVHDHPVPPEELGRYSPNRDPHSEQDIARYVESQAPDEVVQHVEQVRRDVVLGDTYEVWDVTTDKDRWWVLTNMTNLYSQQHFPSLDYTLSFHIGLMMRLKSRRSSAASDDPSPFEDVLRRMDQVHEEYDEATEAEHFQSVGLQLREALISLVGAIRRRVDLSDVVEFPKDADVVGWTVLLFDRLCSGGWQKELRRHLKSTAKSAWQLVGWLTHHRDANRAAAIVAIDACHHVLGNSIMILERSKVDAVVRCHVCGSRRIRTHFDIAIGDDGDYYLSCAACGWSDHPGDDT
jgi:hypothetical protein